MISESARKYHLSRILKIYKQVQAEPSETNEEELKKIQTETIPNAKNRHIKDFRVITANLTSIAKQPLALQWQAEPCVPSEPELLDQ